VIEKNGAYVCEGNRENILKSSTIRKDTGIGSVTGGKDLLVGWRGFWDRLFFSNPAGRLNILEEF
jgi:hypothetical protein